MKAEEFLREQEYKQIGVTSPDRLWLKRWFVEWLMEEFASQFAMPGKEKIIEIPSEEDCLTNLKENIYKGIIHPNPLTDIEIRAVKICRQFIADEIFASLSVEEKKAVNIIELLNEYSTTDIEWLKNVYGENATFIDPMDYHKIADDLKQPDPLLKENNETLNKDYLNECIEKATPNLSKIKDVDKELDEIRGIKPSDLPTEEEIEKYIKSRTTEIWDGGFEDVIIKGFRAGAKWMRDRLNNKR
jgi:hypothetical protein